MVLLKKIYKLRKKIKLIYYKNKGIKIGKNCEISPYAYLDCHRPNKKISLIRIGNNVRISRWAMLVVADTINNQDPSIPWNKRIIKYKKIIVGNNVFIGAQTIILPGAQIGDNVIIGANSVVKGKIPSKVIVAGSPAKIIRSI